MSHKQQRFFCKSVKKKFPKYFKNCIVADVGSLDINGSNRWLFRQCEYVGIDLFDGENVDVVGVAHQILPGLLYDLNNIGGDCLVRERISSLYFDTIISTEALEHDKWFELTLKAIYESVKPGGLILITAAGEGRKEHGTTKVRPLDSPGTNDYYKNVTNEMFASVLPPSMFDVYYIGQDSSNCDFQFYGVKK